ncbi:hypothetical protein LTSEMIN_2006, partial [Salmonella enterica subsp. enterica serovar Minnesota str. A4-603]
MVSDQRHRMKRVGFYQRAGEYVAHVILRALARGPAHG